MGRTTRSLLYQFIALCLLNVGDPGLCAYKQYFPVEKSYAKAKPSATNEFNSPKLLIAEGGNDLSPEPFLGAQSFRPNPHITPPFNEIVLESQRDQFLPSISQTLAPDQANTFIPSPSEFSNSFRPSYTSSFQPNVVDSEPVQFNPFQTPPQNVFSNEFSPVVSFGPQSQILPEINIPVLSNNIQPNFGPNQFVNQAKNILSSEFNPVQIPARQPPIILPETISYATPPIPTVVPEFNNLPGYFRNSQLGPYYQTPNLPNPEFNPVSVSPIQLPFMFPEPVSFAPLPIQQYVPPLGPIPVPANNIYPYVPLETFDNNEFFITESPYIPYQETYAPPIEIDIDADINTIVSNGNYEPAVPYLQNYEESLLPYTLEINIPILAEAIPVPRPVNTLPEYVPPLVPTVPQYAPYPPPPPYLPPIIIENTSKSSTLSTLLLGLIATGSFSNNNNNCGNCGPTFIPYPIPMPTCNPPVFSL